MEINKNIFYIPFLKWYQNEINNTIEINILLQDTEKIKIDIGKKIINLSCISSKKHYTLKLDLFDEIDEKESKYIVNPRYLKFILKKENSNEWDYLITNKNDYKKYISYDWEKDNDNDSNDSNDMNENNFGGNQFDIQSMMNNPELLNMMKNQENNLGGNQFDNSEDIDTIDSENINETIENEEKILEE